MVFATANTIHAPGAQQADPLAGSLHQPEAAALTTTAPGRGGWGAGARGCDLDQGLRRAPLGVAAAAAGLPALERAYLGTGARRERAAGAVPLRQRRGA